MKPAQEGTTKHSRRLHLGCAVAAIGLLFLVLGSSFAYRLWKEEHLPIHETVTMPGDIEARDLASLLNGEMLEHGDREEEEFLVHEPDGDRVVAVRKFIKLSKDAAVVLLRAQPATGTAADLSRGDAHSEGGLARLIYLKWAGNKWAISKKPKGEVPLGSHGEFGKADVLDLRTDLKVLLIYSGGTWQGSSMGYASMIPLDQSNPHLIANILVSSDNSGSCAPDVDCWEAESKITLSRSTKRAAMPDIIVKQSLSEAVSPFNEPAFQDLDDGEQEAEREKYKSGDVPRRTKVSHAQLVYRWRGKSFDLTSGTNIVPGI